MFVRYRFSILLCAARLAALRVGGSWAGGLGVLERVESWEKLRALWIVGCVMVRDGAVLVRVAASLATGSWGGSSWLEDHLAEDVVLVGVRRDVEGLPCRACSG